MRLKNWKCLLAAVLTLALLLNPVAAAAGAAASGDAADANLFRQSASLLKSMFSSGSYAAGPAEQDQKSPFQPLLDRVGEYSRKILEDEELKVSLREVLDEILADERIAGYDVDALVVRTLRDERLINILGSVIARHLRDEEFLSFVEQLAGEVKVLLKDPAIVSYLHDTITGLLEDERINELVFEIINLLLYYAEQFKGKLGDGRLDAALQQLADDLTTLFKAPVLKYAEEIMEDERVVEALDKILSTLQGLDERFVERLKADEDFSRALDELLELFLGPLSGISDRLVEDVLNRDALQYLVEILVAELTNFGGYSEETEEYTGAYPELFSVLELLQDDLDAVLAGIGAELSSTIDHYSEHGPFDEPGEGGGGGGCMEADIDASQVEDQVSDFLNYWAEVAGWVVQKKIERGDLQPLMEKYFGEESPYLGAIMEALSQSAGTAQEQLMAVVNEVLSDYTAGLEDELMALLDLLLYGDPADEDDHGLAGEIVQVVNAVASDKLAEMQAGELLDLVEGRAEEVLEALMKLIDALPLDLPDLGSGGSAGGGDLLSLLNDIVLELPFETLADLIKKSDIKELTRGLFKIVDNLPLDAIASYLKDNSDELGYNIAHSLLNGIADGIEFPEPEDPRVTAIMQLLKSEERLRRFYLDLGGKDPEKITAESSEGEIILQVLLEVAGDRERIERFRIEIDERSKPVAGNLLEYGKKLGDWFLGGLRSFAGPYIKRALASFLIFTPRGYEDQFKADPATWLDYERISEHAAAGGLLAGEMLTRSLAARFVDDSMFRFLVEHKAVEDFATPERLGVIHHFFAEIIDAEQLKALKAADGAAQYYNLLYENLHRLRSEKPQSLIKPDSLTRDLNSLLAGLLPGSPGEVFRFSIESLSLTVEEIVEKIAAPFDALASEVREKTGGLVKPLGNIPADLLDDAVTRKVKDDILAAAPGLAMELAARILEDERLDQACNAAITTVVGELVDKALEVANAMAQDPRLQPAVEEAIVMVLTGNDLPGQLGNLVGDMLEDELLFEFVDHLLAASRIIAVGGYSCPPGSEFYRPQNFLGGTNPTHGFESEPDLPAKFPFVDKTVIVRPPVGSTDPVLANNYFFEMGCNNGLYMFADEVRNWLDPNREFPRQTPGSYLRNYIPNTYLTQSRVRETLAGPVAALLSNTLKALPAEKEAIKQKILGSFDDLLAQKPLQVLADYLRADPKLPGLLQDCLSNLPYDSIVDLLHDNVDIESLLEEAFAALPLEEAAGYIHGSKELKGIIFDAGINIEPGLLQPLLKIDGELPQLLLQRALAFPVERVVDFLMAEQHLYRVAYMGEDLKTRFISDLLVNPELIQVESDLVKEKVAEANYSLAQGISHIAEKFVNNESLIDYIGKRLFDIIGQQYGRVKDLFRFLLGLPRGGCAEDAPAPQQAGPGSSRCGEACLVKEGA